MTYPQDYPTWMQAETRHCAVLAGPVCFAARAPYWYAIGGDRGTKEEADQDADEIEDIFNKCPRHQFGYAAQAAMGYKSALTPTAVDDSRGAAD